MQIVAERNTAVDINAIYAMRHSGATLQQIADKIGKTKERVRQILVRKYGSTKHKLLSTEQLCRLSGLPRNRVMGLVRDGIITPARCWDTNGGLFVLWSSTAVTGVNHYFETHRFCKVCHGQAPNGRRYFCSRHCYDESRKYKYKSVEAKLRHLMSIKRYREKCKALRSGPS